MNTNGHERAREGSELSLAAAFGGIAAALHQDDVDPAEVLDRLLTACLRLLGMDAAGAVLKDPKQGRLVPVAASSEDARSLELVQLQVDEGPCLDATRQGFVVTSPDLEAERGRWPAFCEVALTAGFRSVVSVPMRLRRHSIGGLNVFGRTGGLPPGDLMHLAQTLTHLTALNILSQQAARKSAALVDQLQHALNSRVVIEQAKGVIAERFGVGTDAAFDRIRRYARDHNQKLGEVCAAIIRGEIRLPRV